MYDYMYGSRVFDARPAILKSERALGTRFLIGLLNFRVHA